MKVNFVTFLPQENIKFNFSIFEFNQKLFNFIIMKKIFSLLVLCIVILLSACSTENPTNPSTTTPFQLKYEIITSAPTSTNFPFGPLSVIFINGTSQPENDTIPNGITQWSKEVTVTTTNRPYFVSFGANVVINSPSGTITGKIYQNGRVIATQVNQANMYPNFSNFSLGSIGMSYSIN
jgi:hypothetical protein